MSEKGKADVSTVFQVAEYYLNRGSMSQKKLQKMVYYAYCWTLTLLNENVNQLNNRLFSEKIQAWVHGPVCPDLYAKYRDYGWELIPQHIGFDYQVFNDDVLDVLNQVWDVYSKYTANQLESISHQEEPWKKARIGYSENEASQNIISDIDIFEYYSKRLA